MNRFDIGGIELVISEFMDELEDYLNQYPDIPDYNAYIAERLAFETFRDCAKVLGKRQRAWKHPRKSDE